MEGRRRLLLLVLIIVAVTTGAVGLSFVSLFEAEFDQEVDLLRVRLVAAPGAEAPHRASLIRLGDAWVPRTAAAEAVLPSAVLEIFRLAGSVGPEPAVLTDPRSEFIVVARQSSGKEAELAWTPLDDLRRHYYRAALEAALGLLVLLAGGVALFYRMTAPLLKTITASEARYRTLFAGTAEGVLLIGESIEECNPRAAELFGCPREAIVGQSWPSFLRHNGGRDECLHQFRVHIDQALANVAKPFVCRFTLPGGRVLIAEIMLRRLDEGGRLPRILASLRDVTDREQAADALRDAERNLRESREKLVQAGRSSALVELAAGIAHEVNQPLTAIANYAQACRRLAGGQVAPELDRSLERIAEQAQRAGDAIHRIQALVNAGPDSRRGIACINRLVREVANLMAEDIAVAGAELHLDLAPDIPPVQADPLQIQQVVMQLLRNALESVARCPLEQRQVTIASQAQDGRVEVTVTDSGGGVGREDAGRIFEPFYSTKEDGVGMGLPISMSIIRAHAGELEFDPACRQGACFRFRLAAAERHEGSAAACRDTVAP